ncbi:MAG: hypothetical protein EAX81_02025 [Candidatus Thorarchaeota archaeon]|nr:hypothetical protein [Candidatus Thorarchaeota archaeon]
MRGKNKLEWKPIDLERRLKLLVDAVNQIERTTPKQNTRLLKKTRRWSKQLNMILDSISNIRTALGPILENAFGMSMKDDELLQVAMFQPSTKNLFLELETHFRNEDVSPVKDDDFTDLIALGEMSQVLALVGDAAISMAVLHQLWKSRAADVGMLTQHRANVVSNQHLAEVCDRWQLYDYRIHFDPAGPSLSEMEHDKGTLLEAIYGIVYIHHGLDKVRDLVTHIVS